MYRFETFIFGAGGHGKVVLDIFLSQQRAVLGFLDGDPAKKGQKIRGREVLGGLEYLEGGKKAEIALGIGDNGTRFAIFEKIKALGCNAAQAIHSRAIVSEDVELGEGVVIMPGAVVNPGCVLEDGVVVNTGATVDHDCHLKRFCQIWPGAHLAGSIEVGEFSYIGTGASVIQNIKIGDNVMIGAGAAVVTDIGNSAVAVGVPARVIKERE